MNVSIPQPAILESLLPSQTVDYRLKRKGVLCKDIISWLGAECNTLFLMLLLKRASTPYSTPQPSALFTSLH